jgi:hypothetical protein
MSEGEVIGWVIYDPETKEIVIQCDTRKEVRELVGQDGKIGKVVESH